MERVGAWFEVGQHAAALADPIARDAVVRAVAGLGLSDAERRAMAEERQRRTDPAAVVVSDILASAGPSTNIVLVSNPVWSDAALDTALATAGLLRRSVEAGEPPVPDPPLAGLEALPPGDTAALLVSLLGFARDRADRALARRAQRAIGCVLLSTSPARLRVAPLLEVAADLVGDDRAAVLRGLALTPTDRLLRGVAEVMSKDRSWPAWLPPVLGEVEADRRTLRAPEPYCWWRRTSGRTSPEADPPSTQREPPPEPVGGGPSADDRAEFDEVVWRGGVVDVDPVQRRASYVRLDVATGTAKPDVVVVEKPFRVTLGLQPRRDTALVATSPLSFPSDEDVELEVVLLYDPASIGVTGSPRSRLAVNAASPYPTVTLTCVARYGEDLAAERRLGVQVLRDDQVVAVAWRTLVVAEDEQRVTVAAAPPVRPVQLLDLDPLLGEAAPDLLISVARGDAGADSFVWTAYAADPAVRVPDLPSTSTLDGDVAAFALETRRSIQFSTDPAKDYLGLAGRARRIGRAIPDAIQATLRTLVDEPGRSVAPAVLLLTEELTVPWELAAFEPVLNSDWGGASPFLGAHVAVSRWPLTEHRPRPRPGSTVAVRAGAVLTADYAGIAGWGRLENAVAEAAEVASLFDPPAVVVDPEIWTVIDLFRGTPPADLMHVALHGQFDAQGDQEGIVLLARGDGPVRAQFLTATELENGQLGHAPFVFLNACQVGTDERVLGDYGGFASTLLRIGASAVVAPLWNVRDDVAARFAGAFYAATWIASEPVPVAEAVRALRATYTEAGVRGGDPALHATLLAYQVFGHPRLRLTRGPAPASNQPG